MYMKIYLFIFFVSLSAVTFAQDKVADKTLKKFLLDFNAEKYNNIYDTFSAEFQQKMTKAETINYLSNIHKMIGGFKKAEFKFMQNRNFYYFLICKDDHVNADFLCSINTQGQFDYLTFKRIGGSGNPPPVGKLK